MADCNQISVLLVKRKIMAHGNHPPPAATSTIQHTDAAAVQYSGHELITRTEKSYVQYSDAAATAGVQHIPSFSLDSRVHVAMDTSLSLSGKKTMQASAEQSSTARRRSN